MKGIGWNNPQKKIPIYSPKLQTRQLFVHQDPKSTSTLTSKWRPRRKDCCSIPYPKADLASPVQQLQQHILTPIPDLSGPCISRVGHSMAVASFPCWDLWWVDLDWLPATHPAAPSLPLLNRKGGNNMMEKLVSQGHHLRAKGDLIWGKLM